MPLRKGFSRKTVSANIKTIVDEWKGDGSIGTSKPKTRQQTAR